MKEITVYVCELSMQKTCAECGHGINIVAEFENKDIPVTVCTNRDDTKGCTAKLKATILSDAFGGEKYALPSV